MHADAVPQPIDDIQDSRRPMVALRHGPMPLCRRIRHDIVLVEDSHGWLELVEVVLGHDGVEEHAVAAPGAAPPRGRYLAAEPAPFSVDESAETGVRFVMPESLRRGG